MRKTSLVIWLILVWLAFVVSLTGWWMIFSLRTIERLGVLLQDVHFTDQKRMMVMEGSVLILCLLLGGIALVYFALREQRRLREVKHFFAAFSHDLKTSLARLILQSEPLVQQEKNSDKLKNFQRNLLALQLQLENSLHLAEPENRRLALESMDVKSIISRLHTQWPEMKFNLQGSGRFTGDAVAVESIFKNLVSNSVLHGGADEIQVSVRKDGSVLEVEYSDNGKPLATDIKELGRRLQPSTQGTGIGLYLVQSWVERLQGRVNLHKTERGSLAATLRFPGAT